MQIYDVIADAQGGRAIPNLAQAFGIAPEQAEAAVRTILPELVHGLERNTLSRGGLADLVAALGDGHHEVILENPLALADPRVRQDGNAILGHILGSKDRSRGLALQAARASGLGEGLIQMLLPILAQMLMGAVAKWAKGGLGDVIGRLPGGQGGGGGGGRTTGGGGFELPRSELPQGGYPMPPLPGGGLGQDAPAPQSGDGRGGGFQIPWPRSESAGHQTGGGFPSPMPGAPSGGERRGSGFELPQAGARPEGGFPMPPMPGADGGQMGGPVGGQGGGLPLPVPGGGGGNNPYGDLSDILRRGGANVGGNPVGGIVRNVLGSLLGFQSKGIIGWIIRLIVLRWGWGLVKRILGRALLGGR